MKKVFISYSHNDINVAKTICRYLEEKRITCWFSGRDIIPGQKWSGEIFRAIKECEVVILVHSKNYSYSDNALREIDNASNFKKTIIPIIIDTTPIRDELEYYLSSIHKLKAYPNYLDYLETLYHSVCNYINEEMWHDINDKQTDNALKNMVQNGNTDAQNYLGICFAEGKGVERNEYEAFKWFKLAAEKGHAEAMNNMGRCYYIGIGIKQNYSEAINWFRKSAEMGNPSAQYNIGVCYYKGYGVSQDYTEAILWFSKAAEQNYTDALCYLAQCYMNGIGVNVDCVEAKKCIEKAANNGSGWAQNQLGILLCQNKDFKEAAQWFKKAADQGNKDAQNNLDKCLSLL